MLDCIFFYENTSPSSSSIPFEHLPTTVGNNASLSPFFLFFICGSFTILNCLFYGINYLMWKKKVSMDAHIYNDPNLIILKKMQTF